MELHKYGFLLNGSRFAAPPCRPQSLGPVHTYPFSFEKATFLCGLAFRPHVSGENGDRKRNFSKTLSRMEIFENSVFVWTVKTELYENDGVAVLDPAYPAR